ncbi:phospholactate guanylyltransferase [Natronoarchaeum philippinense]|uniref:2-phospho-L-lactate guanylyltransferase n=1 Tax=Natronoarchaeum philippinense TaxID=558529 RepID=A0A285P7Z0_NATPI|nr:2-phospho-L-lactate guanylyltransferase [Natronoarchaeum philippinense]SNZ17859.1 phospholactate guanylyltransferase [Natronoarchaeum philippinense]
MRAVVPFDADRPKTRLADVLDERERSTLARAMLADVLAAVRAAGGEPTVLSTAPVDVDAPVRVDDRALTPAVNDALADAGPDRPVAVVMADLGLATGDALADLFDADGEVVIAPGRGGGTNALAVGHPEFRVDYHGLSYRDHRRIAEAAGASVSVVDSQRLSTDIDEPADLVELLLHADGRATAWLRDAGFELAVEDGRADVVRSR